MKKILDLKQAFVKRIQRSTYIEARIIFDRYVTQSLKKKTREKRSKQNEEMVMKFQVHDDIIISKVSPKDLLSSSHTKAHLTELFGYTLFTVFQLTRVIEVTLVKMEKIMSSIQLLIC